MSDDEFWNGYMIGNSDCNNNSEGGGIALGVFIFLYPYIPFMIVGYEVFNYIGSGMNIIKWFGALLGGGVGLFWYLVYFRAMVDKFGIKSSFWYWVVCYLFASLLFIPLSQAFSTNEATMMICNLWNLFFNWGLRH